MPKKKKDQSKTREELIRELEELRKLNTILTAPEKECKQVVDELRESEEKYISLFENMDNGFALHEMVFDKAGTPIDYIFLNVNEAFEKLTNLKKEDLIGRKVTKALPGIEKDPADWIGTYGKVVSTGNSINFENYSEPLKKWYSIVAYRPNEGQFAVLIQDITDRKQAEEMLIEERDRANNILKGTNAGTWDWNIQSGELKLNERWAEIMGYTLKELEPIDFQTWSKNVHPDDLPIAKDKIEQHFSGKQDYYNVEFRQPHKDGSWVWVIARGKIIEWTEDGKPLRMSGTHLEITNRKKIEAEKVKLEEQLLQAQKMEAIGTLAGGIAHDFNNILGVIMGYTDLTLSDPTDKSLVIKYLQRVMSASERAKEMVSQILAFSRKSEQIMGSVNIGKVINETIRFLRSTIPTTIEIKSNIEKNLGLVFGNATQINQVLMNLCTNAAHAMREEGGLLEITLKKVVFDADYAVVSGLDTGIYQQLIVSDTGCGMSKKLTERIFEPYFTTKKEGEGTGMGLAVIYGIIKNHRGQIKVYSEPEKGTAFNVFFPVLATDKTETRHVDPQIIKGNNERILFVDDEVFLAELGTQMLKKLGYRVDSRTSSIEALEAFKADHNKFDLVVTDMTMPNMTGIKLASEIHKINPEIPVVLCTGFSSGIDKNNFKKLGINALVMKPVVKRELAKAIREVLDKKRNN